MISQMYPLKFIPQLKRRVWGGDRLETIYNKQSNGESKIGESWEMSSIEGSVSIVSNGNLSGKNLLELIETYQEGLVGKKVFKQFGNVFPLLIKLIDARDNLSIQVHPDNKLAFERYNSYGKTEMWYVLQAEKDSIVINGFSECINQELYKSHIKNNTIEDVLVKHKVNKGDVFYVPAGRVHAIGAGVLLAEIQQTADITYRIYDFDRIDNDGKKRKLHIEESVKAVDFNIYDDCKTEYKIKQNQLTRLVKSPYFVTDILCINKALKQAYDNIDSFVILIVVEGTVDIWEDNFRETLNEGEIVLIPASIKTINLAPIIQAKLLQVYID